MPLLRAPQYYRQRAGELRAAADASHSSDNRNTLNFFAADYDEMAEEAAAAERIRPPLDR